MTHIRSVTTAIHICFSEQLYTGKERDAESGNDYFGARYYASSMGRFMSPDRPVDQQKEDPQSMNLYAYVRNRPLTSTDPTGNYDCTGGTMFCVDLKLANIAAREASVDVNNLNMFALQKLQDVTSALGTAGDHNGVKIGSADLGGSDSEGNITGAETKGKTITFNSRLQMSTDMMAAALVHEGTHVLQNERAESMSKSWLSPTGRPIDRTCASYGCACRGHSDGE